MIKSILSCVNWKTLFYGLVCLLFPIVAYVIYIGVALSLLLGLIYIIKSLLGLSGFLMFLILLITFLPSFCFSALKFAHYIPNIEGKLFDRMIGSLCEKFDEKFDEKNAKFVLFWLLTDQQPSENELAAIKGEFGDDYVRDRNKTLNEGDLKNATELIGKLDKKKKKTIVESLFELSVADKVIGDREWKYLLQVMDLIDLDAVNEELFKVNYSPYRAVFHNPFAKSETTELVNSEFPDNVLSSKESGSEMNADQLKVKQLKLGKR